MIGSVKSETAGVDFKVFQDQTLGGYSLENESTGEICLLSVASDGSIRTIGGESFLSLIDKEEDSFFEKVEEIISKSKGLTPHDVGTVKKHPFEYQKPTDEQVAQITAVREAMKAVYDNLMSLPESRERSIAITKLEEASMWANKGIIMQ